MSRTFVLTLVAASSVFVLPSCSSRIDRNHAPVQGNGAGQPGNPNGDPNGGDPGEDDTTEQPGGGDDGGTPIPGQCVDAPSGWRAMATMPTAAPTGVPRDVADMAWNGHELFLVHRWYDPCTAAGCTAHDETFAYDPAANAWRTLPNPPDAPFREYLHGLALDGRWILFESSLSKVAGATMEGAIFDPATNAWTKFPAAPVDWRDGIAIVAATTTHELVFWGGWRESASGDPLFADGAAFSFVTNAWRTLAPSPLPAGGNNVTTWDGARMNIIYPQTVADGGEAQNAAAAYDPATDTWTSLPLPADKPRMVFPGGVSAAVPHATPLLATAMFAGDYIPSEDAPLPSLRDGHWFDSDTGKWTHIPDPGTTLLPTDVAFAAAFGAQGRFYVWGGRVDTYGDDSTDVDTGMVYDLAKGTWSATPTDGAPSPREGAQAVWTGCDAIVLGGRSYRPGADGSETSRGALFRPE